MFFRRAVSRQENKNQSTDRTLGSVPQCFSPARFPGDEKRNSSVLQLTPLWEHIIRTKSLPENVNENEMFKEIAERLKGPEWQVRQHALRVLVDVLIVMGPQCDQFMSAAISPLVENLGHSAPAVRKGALDALKVYMTETAMPETVMLEIISLGMDRKCIKEQLDDRVCIGVMLSIPSLLHTTISSPKQTFVLRAAIDALTVKMIQVTYQEIALKILVRIREMIGVREFSIYIAHGAYKEFELLCNVYGLPATPSAEQESLSNFYIPSTADSKLIRNNQTSFHNSTTGKIKRTELCWRDVESGDTRSAFQRIPNSADFTRQKLIKKESQEDQERVIMETEIEIDNTAVMMRILEASDSSKCSENDESPVNSNKQNLKQENCGVNVDISSVQDHEEQNTLQFPSKRVTFGGEEVKLRTPDSDSVLQSDGDEIKPKLPIVNVIRSEKSPSPRPKTANEAYFNASSTYPPAVVRMKSASPIKRSRRPSFGSAEEPIASPKAAHRGIEVLHNLQQRSPSISPARSRQSSISDQILPMQVENNTGSRKASEKKMTWESLGLISEDSLQNIKSGVRKCCFST